MQEESSISTKNSIRLVLCYTLLWTSMFEAVEYLLHDAYGLFMLFDWQLFVPQMAVLLCLHLPMVVLFRRLRGLQNRNALILTSTIWGCVLAPVQWTIYNALTGGNDSGCDPYTGLINWGCGISPLAMAAFLVAGGVSGCLAGWILAKPHSGNGTHRNTVT